MPGNNKKFTPMMRRTRDYEEDIQDQLLPGDVMLPDSGEETEDSADPNTSDLPDLVEITSSEGEATEPVSQETQETEEMVTIPRSLLERIERNSKEQLFQRVEPEAEKEREKEGEKGGARSDAEGASGEDRDEGEISDGAERRSRRQQAEIMREFFGAKRREDGKGWEPCTPPRAGPPPAPKTNSSARRRRTESEAREREQRRERSTSGRDNMREGEKRRRARSTPTRVTTRRRREEDREEGRRQRQRIMGFLGSLVERNVEEAERMRKDTIFAKVGSGREEEKNEEIEGKLLAVRRRIQMEDRREHGANAHASGLCELGNQLIELEEQVEEKAVAVRIRELRLQHDELVERGIITK